MAGEPGGAGVGWWRWGGRRPRGPQALISRVRPLINRVMPSIKRLRNAINQVLIEVTQILSYTEIITY